MDKQKLTSGKLFDKTMSFSFVNPPPDSQNAQNYIKFLY